MKEDIKTLIDLLDELQIPRNFILLVHSDSKRPIGVKIMQLYEDRCNGIEVALSPHERMEIRQEYYKQYNNSKMPFMNFK